MNENPKKPNIVVPTLCALIIAGGVFWFATRSSPAGSPVSLASATTALQPGGQASQTSAPSESVRPQSSAVPITTNNVMKTETKKFMNATFHTNKGNFTIEFNPNTPSTVANFVKLAEAGFYNGTKFHRVIKGFMNQGGDPLSKDDALMSRWGTGGPGYQFADEIGPSNHNDVGTISMANAGPNTNGSQFFVNVADNGVSLDKKHTVFGKVTSGLDAVLALRLGDKMNSVTISEA